MNAQTPCIIRHYPALSGIITHFPSFPRNKAYRTRRSVAFLAALAIGAVPAFLAPQARADSGGEVWTNGSITHYYGKNGASGNSSKVPGGEDVIVTNSYTYAYGGLAYSSLHVNINPDATEANNNALILQSGAQVGSATGGKRTAVASDAAASGNTVTLAGGIAEGITGGDVMGGPGADASRNTVLIQNGTVVNSSVGGRVCGGRAHSGHDADASNNTVHVTGGTVGADEIYGGTAIGGDGVVVASNNTVILDGGSFTQSTVSTPLEVIGGVVASSSGTGTAQNNTIVLGAKLDKDALRNAQLYGGYLYGGTGTVVSGNTLKVQGNGLTVGSVNNFENYVFGASALSASTPALTLSNQGAALAITKDVMQVGFSGASFALGSTIPLMKNDDGFNPSHAEQSERLEAAPDGVPVTTSTLAVNGNTLSATFSALYLYGDGGTNTAGQRETGNTLTLDTDTQATAAFGGRATTGEVSGNIANMSAGTLVKDSSNALSGNLYGGYADAGNATGNTVSYSGGTVQGDIYGGYSDGGGATTGNTVTLAHSLDGGVYGGNNAADVSGNTLRVQASALQVGGAHNFENFKFTLPAGAAAGDTVLTVTTPVALGNVNISVGGSMPRLAAGEKLTLISSVTGTPASTSITAGYELSDDGGALVITAKAAPPTTPATPATPTPPATPTTPAPTPTPVRPPFRVEAGNNSSPTLGDIGLLLSGLALAGAAAPALRRRERKACKQG